MHNTTASVENIIYGSFVKMDRLEKIVFETFSNTSIAAATELNIFIDLYSVLKSIFSESYITDISDNVAITSGIINMCSHYRSFFKRLSLRTKLFLVLSFNTCNINEKFVAGYNSEFKKKSEIPLFNKIAMDNFELMDILCPYLPDIHFAKSVRNYESAVIIANIIETLNDGNPNLIISKDMYPLQLCALYPYTSYLYPIKRRGGIDESVMIPISEKPSFRKEFWNFVADRRQILADSINYISPINYPLFNALNRFPERGIGAIQNSQKAASIIHKFASGEDIKIPYQQLYSDDKILTEVPMAEVESRLKALDIQFMLPYYKNDPESKMIRYDNLSDPSAINTINARFFAHNPLDLNKL